jgi:hypothetical protein
MGVINYRELQRQVYNYDFLVYICGIDVSAYIQNIDFDYTDRSSPGSVDITLTNPFDQWIFTNQNIGNHWRLTADRYTEKPKYQIFVAKRALSRSIVFKKQFPNSNLPLPTTPNPLSDPNFVSTAIQQDFLQRYAFGPGSCIFSKFDTVKIFVKNPSDPPGTDRWYPAFTGTVDNKPLATNYVSGMSTVTLHAFDIRNAMSGMRIGVNPVQNLAYQQGQANKSLQTFFDSDATGFFKDFYPSNPTHSGAPDNIFAGKSFPDMVSLIVTGKTGWVTGANPAGITSGTGVGNFKPGKVFRYLNPGNTSAAGKDTNSNVVTNLEAWDNLCLLGSTQQFSTKQQCDFIGKNSFWTSTITPFDGHMHFLIPADGLNISDMIKTSFDGLNNIMAAPDWTNRFALVTQICNQIDYEWTVTGSGDIIFEFPMYDFFPENFGSNKTIYTVDKHIVSDTISDEGGDVLAGIETTSVSPSIGTAQVQGTFNNQAAGITPADVTMRDAIVSNVLASKYGAKIANVTFSGISSKAALHALTAIEFQKRLAEANKVSMDFSFRCWLRPNRPIFHKEKNRIGKITNVRLSLQVLKEGHTSVTIGAVRLPMWFSATKQVVFQHILGGAAMPLSYNSIFEPPDQIVNSDMGATMVNPANTQKGPTSG